MQPSGNADWGILAAPGARARSGLAAHQRISTGLVMCGESVSANSLVQPDAIVLPTEQFIVWLTVVVAPTRVCGLGTAATFVA